jgi:hypothetical protein
MRSMVISKECVNESVLGSNIFSVFSPECLDWRSGSE